MVKRAEEFCSRGFIHNLYRVTQHELRFLYGVTNISTAVYCSLFALTFTFDFYLYPKSRFKLYALRTNESKKKLFVVFVIIVYHLFILGTTTFFYYLFILFIFGIIYFYYFLFIKKTTIQYSLDA